MALIYQQNYGPFADFSLGRPMTIYTKDLNKDNIDLYFTSVLNILRDGIETEIVAKHPVRIVFADGMSVELYIPNCFDNFIMWKLILAVGEEITSEYLIFDKCFTQNVIKKFIDKFLILKFRKSKSNMELNNIINEVLFLFKYIDEFSMFLANTCNEEDYIKLMNENQEFYDILHLDLSNVPLEEVNKIANEKNKRMVDIIANSDHCFRDSFRAKQAINEKQHRELAVLGGTKPDGMGGVFDRIINSNYLTTGLQNIYEHYIEENSARTAQMLSKNNVSDSGHFARLLGLNNQDTILHPDPNYDCHSRNYIKRTIKNEIMLQKIKSRYYRLYPDGIEYRIKGDEFHLIGQTIYLRSPMTCKSKAEGKGICYKCYGDVAFTNSDINIGKIASELLSSELTQRLLSAKHLLESAVRALKWCSNFADFMLLDGNLLSIREDIVIKDHYLVIDTENIHVENEYDQYEYNEYICSFIIRDPAGVNREIYTEDTDNMFLTKELSNMIDSHTNSDGICEIPLSDIVDINLFVMTIHNDGLTKTLKQLKDIIDKDEITRQLDIDSISQLFIETVCIGNLNIDSIHCEVIISNQIRDNEDILEEPDWSIPNNKNYAIYTLNKSLNNNPSVTISLSYERIKRALCVPITYRKRKPSFMDLFFVVKPQMLIADGEYTTETPIDEGVVCPVTFKTED